MKIAISCQGNDLSNSVDPRFGRAQGFIIYDSDTGSHDYVDNNQNLNAAQGAGIQSAQNVAATGATAVITGHVGPKAFLALSKGNIDVYLCETGSVEQAIDSLNAGKLQKTNEADRPGHW